ncbi:superkiller complex protein 2-like [Ciona intestinalis]
MVESEEFPQCGFNLLETSVCGELVVTKLNCNNDSLTCQSLLLPIAELPVLKSASQEVIETCLNLEELAIFHRRNTQTIWTKENDLSAVYSLEQCPPSSTLQVERNETTGEILGVFEEDIHSGINLTAKNSCTMARAPGAPVDRTRGSSNNFPFWPGGMEEPNVDELISVTKSEGEEIDFQKDLLSCPAGFEAGVAFEANQIGQEHKLNMSDIFDQYAFEELNLIPEPKVEVVPEVQSDKPLVNVENETVDKLLPSLNLKSTRSSSENTAIPGDKPLSEEKWAYKVDIDTSVTNFHQQVPVMARTWPFELDTFQKQAVLKLEDRRSVFVAAHTSAGKTVVAEYAIALSAKHMTRVIYTSPIKALSNQKFRDFNQTFSDVGLITGDVQINPDAFCLIMTTEILRSMLYNGSDTIRDLEWVIFDEVHYINDSERGVVWEEVLIMLPVHCNVVLLSATVPNTMEFANWIGRTKQKKIYVISTQKRPVPLTHYLYTGNSNKTNDQMFLIVDSNRKFDTVGYQKALTARTERSNKQQKTGAKVQRITNPASDKGIWLSLLNRLCKLNQLPIVAFTFSRKRCDENAALLSSLDLTSSQEKSEIHIFVNKCVKKLKGSDQSLPQVQQMSEQLQHGIGVHHSGILPILKEVVEMLFARGLVKLLFATETFAMGVNMPARTVVFDSLRKHDGTKMRNLLAGEYIQMAGRAGRRGLDDVGNVVILCKGQVPEMAELQIMMLGRPTKLESQFRLTYGMILNLLRVEQLRVEEVMKRSFSEFGSRKNSKAREQRVRELNVQMRRGEEMRELLETTDYEDYLNTCQELLRLRKSVYKQVLSSPSSTKLIHPGRIVVLSCSPYQQHLAVTLKVNTSRVEKYFTVMVLTEKDPPKSDINCWDPRYIMGQLLTVPGSTPCEKLLDITIDDILVITNKKLKIQSDRIVEDCKRREIPRFSSDLPDKATGVALQELLRMLQSKDCSQVDLITDLGVNEIDMVENILSMNSLIDLVTSAFQCVSSPLFNTQVHEVAAFVQLKKELNDLKYLLSEKSLLLLPEFKQRKQVLKQLRYIDFGGAVQLKGRVACEISSHEIVLTEIIFENVFSTMEPAEIVALLSSVVFQQRVDMGDVTLTPNLKEGMNKIIEVAKNVGEVQWAQGIQQAVEDFVKTLNFGLVEVVYEWAQGTSFKDITNLTLVQEGMVVRTIQRLYETCRDVRNAARVIGDPTLFEKMKTCSELIKRDIVFAASLYTQ